MKDIILACEQEAQLAQYYLELLDLASENTIKSILQIGVNVHTKHEKALRNIDHTSLTGMHASRILINGSALIQKLQQRHCLSPMDMRHTDLYQSLMDAELQLEQFYTKNARQTDIPFNKELFKKFSRDKHKLYVLMNHLCEVLESHDANLESIEFDRKTTKHKNFAS
jgi:rubrerythrin